MVRHGVMDEVQRALMSEDVIQTWNVIQQDVKQEHRNSRRDTRHRNRIRHHRDFMQRSDKGDEKAVSIYRR